MILKIRGFKPLLFTLSKSFVRHISYVCGGMLDIIGDETCHVHRASVSGRKFFRSKCVNHIRVEDRILEFIGRRLNSSFFF